MHASIYIYIKPYQLTVGQAQTGVTKLGLLTEPNGRNTSKSYATQQSPPLRQIGARLLLLHAWASSGNLLLYSFKQT